jgi:hypothetical protein
MSESKTAKEALLNRIQDERAFWHALLAEIGEARMEQSGPMGEWTFKDLAAHLTGWRARTIARLEAAARGQETPPTPWPAHLETDDDINGWIYQQNRNRPLSDVLADADGSYERLAAALAALSKTDLTTPGRFAWMEGKPLAEGDFFGHLHEEHEPSIRACLSGAQGQ